VLHYQFQVSLEGQSRLAALQACLLKGARMLALCSAARNHPHRCAQDIRYFDLIFRFVWLHHDDSPASRFDSESVPNTYQLPSSVACHPPRVPVLASSPEAAAEWLQLSDQGTCELGATSAEQTEEKIVAGVTLYRLHGLSGSSDALIVAQDAIARSRLNVT
jgi:hypothetical protein